MPDEWDEADDEYELDVDDAPAPPSPIIQPAPRRVPTSIAEPLLTAAPPPQPPRLPFLSGVFTFPWYRTSLATWLLLSLGSTASLLTVIFVLIMLSNYLTFRVGLAMGLPTGCLVTMVMSYASASYLAIIESTSEGYDDVDWPDGEWKEWFWTLPFTVGAMFISGCVGYFFRWLTGLDTWLPVLISLAALYPVVQLSMLEAGTLARPFSKPILQSLAKFPLTWLLFYVETTLLWLPLLAIVAIGLRFNPYLTMLAVGMPVATAVLIYGRLMGRLAWWCATDGGNGANG